jgi:hypothetical protein
LIRSILHRLATLLHQANGIFEIETASGRDGSIFPETQARDGNNLLHQIGLLLLQLGQASQRMNKQRRLTVLGLIEPFSRPFLAELEKIVTQNPRGTVEQRPRSRATQREGYPPSYLLGTLAWK